MYGKVGNHGPIRNIRTRNLGATNRINEDEARTPQKRGVETKTQVTPHARKTTHRRKRRFLLKFRGKSVLETYLKIRSD